MDNYDLNKQMIDVWLEKLSSSELKNKVQHVSLSKEEIDTANSFYFAKDRENYILSHQYLRFIISSYLQLPFDQITFKRMAQGKPIVSTKNICNIEFNMAHSNDFLAIAIGTVNSVGIDIEAISEKQNVDGLAKHCFSFDEFKQYAEIHESLRPLAFFRGWARKEAYLKALGTGLSKDLRSFNVNIFDDISHYPITVETSEVTEKQWRIEPITLMEPYNFTAAVVINNSIEKINYRSMSLTI